MSDQEGAADVNKSPGSRRRRSAAAAPSAARAFCCALLALLLLAGITALVLYLVYRPSKPRVTVVGAAVYELNTTSSAAAVSAGMQFTLSVRNPSARCGIFYDRLAAYAVYRGQAITPAAPLPPLFQEEDSTAVVSAVLGGGAAVPVSEEVLRGLAADRSYGLVPVRLVVLGRVKYRAGPFRSTWDGIYVKCDLLVGVKKLPKASYGQVPLLGAGDCAVDT